LCNLGGHLNCNVVNASTYSEIAGIPLAAIGVLYFVFLFVLGLTQPVTSRTFRRTQAWMARAAVVAAGIDFWLLLVQAFAIKSFCLFCLFTYVCTFGHLGMNWLMLEERTWKRLWNGDRKTRVPSFVWAVTLFVCIVTTAALTRYVTAKVGAANLATFEQTKKAFFENWNKQPSKPLPTKSGDGIWGNPAAKIQVAVFSDFECPHCQKAAFALHTALASEKEHVQLVFKNFPLDISCNPLLQQAMHPNACALAHLGFCANKKNRFWDYHDRVFFKLSAREISSSHDDLYGGVKPLFTRAEFDACIVNPEAIANTRADIELGKQVAISSTPTVFINGKRVTLPLTVDLIRDLIRKEQTGAP